MNRSIDKRDHQAPAEIPLRLLMAEMEIILTAPLSSGELRDWLESTRAGFDAMWPVICTEMKQTRPGLFEWLLEKDGNLSDQVEELKHINGGLQGGFDRFRAALESCEGALDVGHPAGAGVVRSAKALSRRGLRLLSRFRLQDSLIARSVTDVIKGEHRHDG